MRPSFGREAHGGRSSGVRSNDLAFSLHCNLMTLLCIAQILMYDRGGQRVSGVCWAFCGVCALLIGAYLGALAMGAAGLSALGFLYLLSYIKLFATFVKCDPLWQATACTQALHFEWQASMQLACFQVRAPDRAECPARLHSGLECFQRLDRHDWRFSIHGAAVPGCLRTSGKCPHPLQVLACPNCRSP